jgi:hypothetical protein
LTYVNIVGDEDEYVTLWTGGANYGGTMDPGRFHIEAHGTPTQVSVVDAERKYFDWRATDKHGIPIYRPLTSGARRNTVPTGYRFGAHYGALGGALTTNRKSSDVGRASEGTVASGGTTRPSRKPKSMITPTTFRDSRGESRQSCPRGYELRRVGKRMMCVKR